MASSTFQVTMVFCSRSRRDGRAKADIGVRREVEDHVGAGHRALDGVQVQQVAFHQAEARAGLRAIQETAQAVEKLS